MVVKQVPWRTCVAVYTSTVVNTGAVAHTAAAVYARSVVYALSVLLVCCAMCTSSCGAVQGRRGSS
eukprot:6260724-Pyramimonas_sp.AAC.1